MKNLTWQNPEQLFVAQELINKVKSKCCGIKDDKNLLMGTLGCINDMLQRDKENRALRKLSRGRMREHYKYLVDRKGPERADVTIEEIEKIRRNTTEKELSDKEHLFRAKTILAACALVLLLLGVLCYKLFL